MRVGNTGTVPSTMPTVWQCFFLLPFQFALAPCRRSYSCSHARPSHRFFRCATLPQTTLPQTALPHRTHRDLPRPALGRFRSRSSVDPSSRTHHAPNPARIRAGARYPCSRRRAHGPRLGLRVAAARRDAARVQMARARLAQIGRRIRRLALLQVPMCSGRSTRTAALRDRPSSPRRRSARRPPPRLACATVA
jgi:hypothetical protein